MVKRGGRPGAGRVAIGADMTEIVGHVIGICDAGESSLMTGVAVGRRIGVPVGVAGDTL